jgi:aryl-alcohol dehydrogenase-like predicted oxidoreductase
MLGLGGWHLGGMSEAEATKTLEVALEGGVRFFDSAESYQSGGSESRIGKLLVPKYRDQVFIMTKSTATTAKLVRQHLEDSLRRLKTDYLDLWQVHSVRSAEDVDDRISNQVFEVMQEAKSSGKTRYIGFTGHMNPQAHARVLERSDIFETCQMPINLADPTYNSFIKNILPQLVDRNIGVIAMKTLANGGFFGGSSQGQHGDKPKIIPDLVSIREALHFVWSLPVSVLVTGPDNAQQMQEKIDLAHSFLEINERQRQQLIDKVAGLATDGSVEYYKS